MLPKQSWQVNPLTHCELTGHVPHVHSWTSHGLIESWEENENVIIIGTVSDLSKTILRWTHALVWKVASITEIKKSTSWLVKQSQNFELFQNFEEFSLKLELKFWHNNSEFWVMDRKSYIFLFCFFQRRKQASTHWHKFWWMHQGCRKIMSAAPIFLHKFCQNRFL